ncbi:MAG: DEAD/DEAH box helicase [Parachlamydiaceae bacterium]
MKIPLPISLEPYREEAEKALQKKSVKEIEFSGSTYQVLVEDPFTLCTVWVFLQLEGKGDIKDAFCSADHHCDASDCLHLAIAYLALFNQTSEPLHQRFARSLWNQLCRIYEERLGDHPNKIEATGSGMWSYRSKSGKKIFEIEALQSDAIALFDQILSKRSEETEETSLKFSNLSVEEISSWRQGKPDPQLRYDLSFWSDIAKSLMKQQEEGVPYDISFKYSKHQLPNWIQIHFHHLRIGFYISEANLPLIIDSLQTVQSPLKVYYAPGSEIGCVTYDKKNQMLHIQEKKRDSETDLHIPSDDGHSVRLNGWKFIVGKGFYAEESHELLKHPILHGEEIAQTLSEHARLISSLITNCHVYQEPTPLSFQLSFDKNWNLHISTYLFEPGDLGTADAWLMNNWAYLDGDGFYPVEGNHFHDIKCMIAAHQVSEFVSQNRGWLNSQEGFQTHVRSIEFQLRYEVSQNQRLTFSRSLEKVKDKTVQQDFGAWIYLKGYGFFSKKASSFHFLLKPGISLSAEQIPLFIRMNQDELELIPHFFNPRCPIAKAGLKIKLTDKQKIKITPEYELLAPYKGQQIQLFDDFVYLKNEGFHEIPLDLRLPEKFRHPLEIEGEDLNLFLSYEIDELYPYAAHLDPQLIKEKEWSLVADLIERAAEKGRGWYRFRLFYQTKRGLVSILQLRKSMNKKSPFGFFQAGLIDLRDERFDWLRRLPKDRFEADTILLTSLEFMRLNAFDPIQMLQDEKNGGQRQSSIALLDDLINLHTPEQPDMGGLLSHLRPYQEVGVQWLWFLYRQQLSGLLCDDMGLGKTHQAMALLVSISNLYRTFAEGTRHHFLIVCPTSVIYHWQEKLQQFLPGLKICSFYGAGRSLETFQNEYDVLLTSYGILRNEQEQLSKLPFEVAVFDEIQVAKNQFSRVYTALTKIKAQMKLGLTGTPIENHLRELKSLFDIVLPSYMPGESDYREIFIKPIEKEIDAQKKKLLNRLIHPFILRRKKEDVLKDLPEKIEEIAYCDLLSYQQKLYTDVLELRRHHLLEELKNEGGSIPYLHIFSLLSSLKQICDHPAVYLKQPQDYQQYSSGKWELFLEILREARESQQKVVVFSQYLGMMDIIEHYLINERIGFASLRGATQNRKEQLQLFNHDPSCEVFVGSLQAAGLGIDLTAGSVVIHYDRWWNAARENQATDRVHRIGQTRGVQVFKLVTKRTFEEKIDAMISRKGRLMEDVVGVDDQNMLKTFSRHDLIELLELVKTDPEHPTEFNDGD